MCASFVPLPPFILVSFFLGNARRHLFTVLLLIYLMRLPLAGGRGSKGKVVVAKLELEIASRKGCCYSLYYPPPPPPTYTG
jgi:hypothetical protein